jgi:hypothetical protein
LKAVETLKGIQAGIAALDGTIGKLPGRFDQIEAALRKDRRNVAGMLVMMRATAGDFDERVTEIEGARGRP